MGLTAVKFWTRKKFKGCKELKRHVNPMRIPIEQKESVRWLENLKQSTELLDDPERCIHIGDRESDIYELFCTAKQAGTHFLVRTCVDRLANDDNHTVADKMKKVKVKGLHRVIVKRQLLLPVGDNYLCRFLPTYLLFSLFSIFSFKLTMFFTA